MKFIRQLCGPDPHGIDERLRRLRIIPSYYQRLFIHTGINSSSHTCESGVREIANKLR